MKQVTAALLIKNGLCLIAKRRDGDHLAKLWEFPGGKIEAGETPEECLRREMNEEFQIDVKVGRFFSESIYSYDTGTIQLLVYWVIWQGNSLNPVVHEEIAWVDKETILNYQFAPADIPIVEKLRCHEGDLLICT
ncbi:MAG: hydrolase [Massilibacillus sp.]|nr:hydrolase [Massilibacillus sp.]